MYVAIIGSDTSKSRSLWLLYQKLWLQCVHDMCDGVFLFELLAGVNHLLFGLLSLNLSNSIYSYQNLLWTIFHNIIFVPIYDSHDVYRMAYGSTLFVIIFEPRTKSRISFKTSDTKIIVERTFALYQQWKHEFQNLEFIWFHFQIYTGSGDSMWFRV